MNYDEAASYWQKKDELSVKMPADQLQKRIETFIGKHNTCALAVADGDFVRCTPIEYNFVDGRFYLFSEGGLKFKALKNNKNVCLAIYEEYQGFGKLGGMQITGVAEMVEPLSEEYLKLLAVKKIPVDIMKKLPSPMNLICVAPTIIDYLDSDLKKDGFGSRQQYRL